MLGNVPRANKITMIFGGHGPESISNFQRCFRQQDHQGRNKVHVIEVGAIEAEQILRICGKAAIKPLEEALQTQQVGSDLANMIKECDKYLKTELLETTHEPEGPAGINVFIRAVMKEATDKGYRIKFERLQPQAVLNYWFLKMLSAEIKAQSIGTKSHDFQRLWGLMRRQYKCQCAHISIRDTEFIGYLDLLAPDNDLVSAVRGDMHIHFYRGLDDAPRIITYDDDASFIGDIIARRVNPDELSSSDLALMAKFNIIEMLEMFNLRGDIKIDLETFAGILRDMPNDQARFEEFFKAVCDTDTLKAAKKMVKHLSAPRKIFLGLI